MFKKKKLVIASLTIKKMIGPFTHRVMFQIKWGYRNQKDVMNTIEARPGSMDLFGLNEIGRE